MSLRPLPPRDATLDASHVNSVLAPDDCFSPYSNQIGGGLGATGVSTAFLTQRFQAFSYQRRGVKIFDVVRADIKKRQFHFLTPSVKYDIDVKIVTSTSTFFDADSTCVKSPFYPSAARKG